MDPPFPWPAVTGVAYSFRRNAFASELTFRLESGVLRRSDGRNDDCIALAEVDEVRFCRRYHGGKAAPDKKFAWLLRVRERTGRTHLLSPFHYAGFRTWEDRSVAYGQFVGLLLEHIRAANPGVRFVAGQHWTTRLGRRIGRSAVRLSGRSAVLVLAVLRRFEPHLAAEICGSIVRAAGPGLRTHRVGRANLASAFPEKSPAERERILRGVWDNLGRVFAEYAHLDQLWDYPSSNDTPGRIVIDPASEARLQRLRDSGKPALFFAAHLASWELPAVAAAAFGLDTAIVYRPSQFGAAEREVLAIRARSMGRLIARDRNAALRVRAALRRGMHVGMLVDQHAIAGIDATFFGRSCKVDPSLARLARLFDCPIHGARVVRLPGDRFRFELTEPIEAPRDAGGRIDVPATMQLITSVIEGWVREHPEQWLWLHRRWR